MSSPIKIRFFDEPEFFVNEYTKTVTCKLSAQLDSLENAIAPNNSKIIIFEDNLLSATTTAKCSPNDVFDIDRGKRIAMARAENKIYRHANSRMKEWIKIFAKAMVVLNDSGTNFLDYSDHNDEYIQEISDSSHPINPLKRGNTKIVSKKQK